MTSEKLSVKERDRLIYENYLVGLQYRGKNQAALFGVSYPRYKDIVAAQKKLHNAATRAAAGENK